MASPLGHLRRRGLLGLGIGLGLGVAGGVFLTLGVTPERSRSWLFWRTALPVFLDYRWTQLKLELGGDSDSASADAQYRVLHEKHAPTVLQLCLDMRGVFVKVGQVGATRSDIFPSEYRDRLEVLLDRVPGLPASTARATIEATLGQPIDAVFSAFDDDPIGAASIGQVHYATIRDSGRRVAVKIHYGPRAMALMRDDLDTLKRFCELAQPEQVPIMDELKRQFLSEFDLRREAWGLATCRANTMPYFPGVVIPSPVMELCTKDVIVMDFLDGTKLVNAVLAEYTTLANALGLTLKEFTAKMSAENSGAVGISKARLATAYVGNTAKRLARTCTAALWNNTAGWVATSMDYPRPPINHAKLINTLVKVHGKQILIDGVFSGDPHPGNIILLKNNDIGLIDYGQIKTLSPADRRNFAKLVILLDDGKEKEVVAHVKMMGFETEHNDDYVLFKTIQVALDCDDKSFTGGKNLQMFMEEMNKRDKTSKIPEQHVMSIRVCVLLRGIATLLGHEPIHIAREWREYAERAIQMFPEGAPDDHIAPEPRLMHRGSPV